MDYKLSQFGWGAVCVRGFIPPAAFMELQSRGILAIAADMRTLEHLTYTPAPDIVHEAQAMRQLLSILIMLHIYIIMVKFPQRPFHLVMIIICT